MASVGKQTEYVHYDWRDPPTREGLLHRIDEFMQHHDAYSHLLVVSSSGVKGKSRVKAADSGFAGNMWLQEKIFTKRTNTSSVNERVTEGSLYCARMGVLCFHIVRKIDAKKLDFSRAWGYQLVSDMFSKHQIKTMMKDLALSLGVHPYVFGVVPESQGRVYVPQGTRIDLYVVNNVFEYMDNKTKSKVTLAAGNHYEIPKLVERLKVISEPSKGLRAVVVCEQRGIRDQMMQMDVQNIPYMNGIMVVMTGGYPDSACRQFLHQLSQCNPLKDVPFMYLSDRDAYGLDIFAILKYGSKSSAYESPTTTCPRLSYQGLTDMQYNQVASKWAEKKASEQAIEESLSQEQQAARERKYLGQVAAAKERMAKSKTTKSNKAAQTKLASLEKAGTFESEEDKVAATQLKWLQSGKPVLSTYDVDHFDSFGVMTWIRDVVATYHGEYNTLMQEVQPKYEQGTVRQAWTSLRNSQMLSQPTQQPT